VNTRTTYLMKTVLRTRLSLWHWVKMGIYPRRLVLG